MANCLYEANNPALYELFKELEIRITNVPLSSSDCLSLGYLIARSSIRSLDLGLCDLSSKCINSLKQGLSESACIEAILIFDPTIDEHSIKDLSTLIGINRNIKGLVIGFCDLHSNGLTYSRFTENLPNSNARTWYICFESAH